MSSPHLGISGGEMAGGNRIGDVIAPLNQIQVGCLIDSHAATVAAQLDVDAIDMGTNELYPTIPVW